MNKEFMNKNVRVSAVALIILLSSSVLLRRGIQLPQFLQSAEKEQAAVATAGDIDSHVVPAVSGGGGRSALAVKDQKAGSAVMVASVSLARKGFVIVHRMDGEMLGKIIGSSALLPAGESENIEITLREPLLKGEKHTATIHFDNGDGFFLPGNDLPAMNESSDGGIIKAEFEAT